MRESLITGRVYHRDPRTISLVMVQSKVSKILPVVQSCISENFWVQDLTPVLRIYIMLCRGRSDNDCNVYRL